MWRRIIFPPSVLKKKTKKKKKRNYLPFPPIVHSSPLSQAYTPREWTASRQKSLREFDRTTRRDVGRNSSRIEIVRRLNPCDNFLSRFFLVDQNKKYAILQRSNDPSSRTIIHIFLSINVLPTFLPFVRTQRFTFAGREKNWNN